MALGRPIVQGIKGVEISDDTITARREIDGGFEVYELRRPCRHQGRSQPSPLRP